MLTLRDAAGLLRAAASQPDLRPLARSLGFDAEAAVLDREARQAFGLDASFGDPTVTKGPGSLRALTFTADPGTGRAQLSRAANRLTSRAAYGLWVLLAVEQDTNCVLLAAATPGSRAAKVAALIVDRARVLDSDAETLRQLAAARTPDDLATHTRFVEILGREAITRRFFRKLEECVGALADSARFGLASARREMALLYASRLLFLGFLESKAWLDGDAAFLVNAFDNCMAAGGGFHARVLLPLFFGTLNTPPRRRAPRAREFGNVPFLNGGLFTPTPVERELKRLRFSDEACGRFFSELLTRYRFTALEETASFEEAAIDPEMLGRSFESLMASGARRSSGAYYTPHALVERVAGLAIAERLGDRPALDEIASMRVLDPACGSGAFLVHVLGRLAALRSDAGDRRAPEVIRREVLSRSIFGVDVNPTAVWLCQLRLWLSIVVDSREAWDQVPPLPNLDRNVRVGDSLAGPAFDDQPIPGGTALRRLRERYARSSGRRKVTLARELDRAERRLAVAVASSELGRVSERRRDLVSVHRGRDLFGQRYQPTRDERERIADLRRRSLELRRRIRSARANGALPFGFPAHFADVASEGGFSMVVGNPPWVRPHHLDQKVREELRRAFAVARAAPWMTGASAAGAGRGFSSQVDLAAVFVERSLQLIAANGVMSLLLPSKLWRSLSAGGMRRLVTNDARVVRIEDYSDMPAAFDAAVYPGLLVASRDRSRDADVGVSVLHRSRTAAHWSSPMASLPLEGTPGAPWLLIPPETRRSFEWLSEHGTPLGESPFGRPLLGVKCGLNDAFIVTRRKEREAMSLVIASNGRVGEIESQALRPVLRGEDIQPWVHTAADRCIVWTHGADTGPLVKLPPGVAKWLAPHRKLLAARSDARRANRWWSLFRTESATPDKPRVVWADIGRTLRAVVLEAGDPTVVLNTCYVSRCPSLDDALALCALLNSPLISAWLSVIAEQARGGYRRYLGWTMALTPLPADWNSCRPMLAEVGRAASRAGGACSEDLLDASIAAYGLRRGDVEPLLAWASD